MEFQYHIFSPYRVCPLGAHVDHQHGIVTGFAINKGVDLWFTPNEDGKVHLESRTFDGVVDFDITKGTLVREMHWGDYARGAKYALKKRFDLKKGMKEFEIGIFFSGLTRSLVNSDYNLRVYECKTAAWNVLAYQNQPLKEFNKTFLRDIPKESYEACKERMPARFARRAEHFYSEYRRVRQGVTAWETGNLELFGKLCFASCESSIHNYECGSPELIAIYEIMRSLEGVYGGRFSGAGFKGACIALVDPACKENVEKELTRQYLEKFPEYEKTFKVFWVKPDDGARFL